MRYLAALVVLHFLLRMVNEPLRTAVVGTLVVALLAIACVKLGGATSSASSYRWLKGHPQYFAMIVIAALASLPLGYRFGISIPSLMANLIFSFVGLYGLVAISLWVQGRIGRLLSR